jgi:hypothetical protein
MTLMRADVNADYTIGSEPSETLRQLQRLADCISRERSNTVQMRRENKGLVVPKRRQQWNQKIPVSNRPVAHRRGRVRRPTKIFSIHA